MANAPFKPEHKDIADYLRECIFRGILYRAPANYPESHSDLDSCIREILNRCDITRRMDHREVWDFTPGEN